MVLQRFMQIAAAGGLDHLGQRFGDLLLAAVEVLQLVDKKVVKCFHLHCGAPSKKRTWRNLKRGPNRCALPQSGAKNVPDADGNKPKQSAGKHGERFCPGSSQNALGVVERGRLSVSSGFDGH
jgi:hypothetical protein